ncbi:hypothetical protein [uncultured Dysosmobacter sp.]|uniref:hypothetical protein n=1 Tax=uncultured Dysosmobacter sp. TaxID=2591384 RepID=UPI00263674E7|nr:hypothetical protein [uncultured Dysosmobacter sp.]
MPLPKPPCTRSCPKRCAVPNCHDPALCGDWAAYQEELEVYKSAEKKRKEEENDYQETRRKTT